MKGLKAWFGIPMWQRVSGGFLLGAFAGGAQGSSVEAWAVPLGAAFVTLLKWTAVPLVLVAVTAAIIGLHQRRSLPALPALLARTFLWFAATAALAACVGLGVGSALEPGRGLGALAGDPAYEVREVPAAWRVLVDIVPLDPLGAISGGRILQLIFISMLVGFVLVLLGERGAGLRRAVLKARDVVVQFSRIAVELAPFGVFALIAALVGTYGFEKLLPLGNFVLALYLACSVHIVFVYGGLLLAHRLDPLKFLRGAAPAMLVAFSTSSSFASLPATMRSVTDGLGVDRDYTAFAVPFGASIKMDACGAIYPALTALFLSQYFGIELSIAQYAIVVAASVLGTFATAGVPGTATVITTLVVTAAGLPAEGIAYLVVIDRVLDMMRTMTNVTGQMLVPVLVARETGLLDQQRYDAPGTSTGVQPATLEQPQR